MKKAPHRMVIYTKDVMHLTGKGERTARKLLTRVRRHYGKDSRSLVTVEEFCAYTGFDGEQVIKSLV